MRAYITNDSTHDFRFSFAGRLVRPEKSACSGCRPAGSGAVLADNQPVDLVGHLGDLVDRFAFDHDADDRLGAGGPHEDAAAAIEPFLELWRKSP
jgi:hypothetical protein